VRLSRIVAGAIAEVHWERAMRSKPSLWATAGTLAIAALLLACGSAVADPRFGRAEQEKATTSNQRSKVAEGEYVVFEGENSGAIGPFGEEIYNFHETWTLWRIANGSYELEGERRFESPKDATHTDRFAVELSRDLTITRMKEFARLKWRRDSGPLTCEFLRSVLHCSSNAKNAGQAIELNIAMREPFGLLWPISAFSLSSLTREAERDARRETRVQLVSIEQPSAEIPVNPMILEGGLRYLGEENIDVAGQPRRAFKFSIKVPLSPELIAWTSPKGLLLAVAVQHEGKSSLDRTMKLVRFQEWAGFE
jgi:hypothetical protein